MKRRLLIIAAATLLIGVALIAYYFRSGLFHSHLAGLIEKQLTKALGVEASVVNLKQTRYGDLDILVTLHRDEPESILSAHHANVSYELIPPRIPRIEIDSAQLTVTRREDGTLNIDPILNRPAGGSSPPISFGSVHFRELSPAI